MPHRVSVCRIPSELPISTIWSSCMTLTWPNASKFRNDFIQQHKVASLQHCSCYAKQLLLSVTERVALQFGIKSVLQTGLCDPTNGAPTEQSGSFHLCIHYNGQQLHEGCFPPREVHLAEPHSAFGVRRWDRWRRD